jgi:hypothetical protein
MSWVLALAAIAIQILNIVWVAMRVKGRIAGSQILLVPCVLWYIGLMLRPRGFFTEKGVELGIVVLTHVTLSIGLFVAAKLLAKRA